MIDFNEHQLFYVDGNISKIKNFNDFNTPIQLLFDLLKSLIVAGQADCHCLLYTSRFGMAVCCGEDKPVYTFELVLMPAEKNEEGGERA